MNLGSLWYPQPIHSQKLYRLRDDIFLEVQVVCRSTPTSSLSKFKMVSSITPCSLGKFLYTQIKRPFLGSGLVQVPIIDTDAFGIRQTFVSLPCPAQSLSCVFIHTQIKHLVLLNFEGPSVDRDKLILSWEIM